MAFKEINGKLVRNFEFKTQTELAQFLLKVAEHADEMHHHPDCKIHKAFQLEITLFTHDKNEITQLDHQLADFIESIYKIVEFSGFCNHLLSSWRRKVVL